MHLLAALLIADSVRTRIEQGDCPIEPQVSRELVDEALCELQKCIAADLVDRHLTPMANALHAAEQCIGELPPTQARVEAMQMIQAALPTAK